MNRQSGRHARTARRLAITVLVTVLAGLLAPSVASAAGCPTSSVEYLFARKVNRSRVAHGLPRLQLDRSLNKVSSYHSWEMKRKRSMYHTALDVLGRRIIGWYSIGENIGYLTGATNLSEEQQAATMFRMFMNSPTHRANILKSSSHYRYQGIGITYQANGTLWITHTFSGRVDPGTSITSSICN